MPAVAVDPIRGGAKVSRQAEAVGWPAVFIADELSKETLHGAMAFCLISDANAVARSCAGRAGRLPRQVRRVRPRYAVSGTDHPGGRTN